MPVTGRQIKAGAAYVSLSLDRREFNSGLRAITDDIANVGKSIAAAGAITTGAGFGILGGLEATVHAASDAQEELNRFRAIFGPLGDDADDFANRLSGAVNRSALDVKRSLATFQSVFVGLEFDPQTAYDMSKAFSQLAIDFGSFNNISDTNRSRDSSLSALSGSAEVLDQFGVNIKAAAIEQELLRLGIQKSAADATEAEKAIARLSIIQQTMGRQGAVGDAIRTSQDFANVSRGLSASLRDLRVAIGQALIPMRTEWSKQLIEATHIGTEFIKQNQDLVVQASVVGSVLVSAGASATIFGLSMVAASVALGGIGQIAGLLLAPLYGVVSMFSLLGSKSKEATTIAAASTTTAAATTAKSSGGIISSLGGVVSAIGGMAAGFITFAATVGGPLAVALVKIIAIVGAVPAAIAVAIGALAFINRDLALASNAYALFGLSAQQATNIVQFGFTKALSIAKDAIGGIFKAVASGNIALAFKIATAGAKAIWFGFVAEIKERLVDFIGKDTLTVLSTIGGMIKTNFQFVNAGLRAVIGFQRIIWDWAFKILSVLLRWSGAAQTFGVDAGRAIDNAAAKAANADAEFRKLLDEQKAKDMAAGVEETARKVRELRDEIKNVLSGDSDLVSVTSSLHKIESLRNDLKDAIPQDLIDKIDLAKAKAKELANKGFGSVTDAFDNFTSPDLAMPDLAEAARMLDDMTAKIGDLSGGRVDLDFNFEDIVKKAQATTAELFDPTKNQLGDNDLKAALNALGGQGDEFGKKAKKQLKGAFSSFSSFGALAAFGSGRSRFDTKEIKEGNKIHEKNLKKLDELAAKVGLINMAIGQVVAR